MQTKVMGVLRVVPGSFAGGDRCPEQAAVARGRGMIAAGADIVEVACGPAGTSRPAMDPATEERTIRGVVEALAGDVRVAVATRSAGVAAAGVAAGATLVVDPATATAPGGDSLPAVAAAAGAGWVAVHDAGAPSRAREARLAANGSGGCDPLGEMIEALGARVARASAAGTEEIYVDPGIGTGRAPGEDLGVLGGLDRLASLGRPLVVGIGDGRLIDVLHAAADVADPAAEADAGAPSADTAAAEAAADADSPSGGDAEATEARAARALRAAGSWRDGPGSEHPAAPSAEADRLEGALVVAIWAMLAGAAIVRTHHVGATVEAARVVGAKPPVGAP